MTMILHKLIRTPLFALLLSVGISLTAADDSPPVYAHYMPWYSTKPVSGKWGWHWTMDHYDPDTIRWNGKREAASHDYPLIGLYDSNDPDALECHALLMKFSGIDGAVIDWYGVDDLNDHAELHRNTLALISWLKKAGLGFAVCYEDQSKKKATKPVKDVGTDLAWVAENWFTDESYLKIEDRPALLVFGPQLLQPDEWKNVVDDLQPPPKTYALPHLAEKFQSDGAFGWPPVDGGKWVSQSDYEKTLTSLQADPANIAVAFPGFKDIYKQAGVGDSYGRIDDRNGATLTETLNLALSKKTPLVQVATWNDFGEGTVIEPTTNLGYRNLEIVQGRLKPKFTTSDLRLPIELYALRKLAPESSELDRAADFLFAGNTGEASALMKKIAAEVAAKPIEPASKYRLVRNVSYRENADDDYAKNRCQLDVYYPADGKKFATVIWFHGGGISKGNREIPMALRNQGVAVVAANYRMSPGVKAPVYIEDAAAAVAWTVKNIAKYGGDPDAVFVSGHSAGGYLASMVGLDKSYLKAHGIDTNQLAGLIPFSGHTITHFTVRKEQGIPGHQAVVDKFAPLYHARKDAPPILLITGDREKELMGRYDENAYFWRMMKVAGHDNTEIRELEGYDHGGMPEPAFPLLLRFIDQHFSR